MAKGVAGDYTEENQEFIGRGLFAKKGFVTRSLILCEMDMAAMPENFESKRTKTQL